MKRPLGPFWRRLLLPAFLSLAAANLLVFAVWTLPRGYKHRNALGRAAAAREEAARLRQRVASLQEREAAIRANRAELRTFHEKHVGAADGELFETVARIEAMVRVPGLKPGARAIAREDVEGTPVERVVLSLPLEGSYGQLVGFLREIEGSQHFLTVDGIWFQAQRERGTSLNVELSAYLRRAAGAKGKRGRRAG